MWTGSQIFGTVLHFKFILVSLVYTHYHDTPKKMCKSGRCVAIIFGTLFFVGCALVVFGIFNYMQLRPRSQFSWNATCIVTQCVAGTVHFQSTGQFIFFATEAIKGGCELYPIDSHIPCFVGFDRVSLHNHVVQGWIGFFVLLVGIFAFVIGMVIWTTKIGQDPETLPANIPLVQ